MKPDRRKNMRRAANRATAEAIRTFLHCITRERADLGVGLSVLLHTTAVAMLAEDCPPEHLRAVIEAALEATLRAPAGRNFRPFGHRDGHLENCRKNLLRPANILGGIVRRTPLPPFGASAAPSNSTKIPRKQGFRRSLDGATLCHHVPE